ncbi:MAG: P63C domain-containing protein [Caulobacterales bacterium]
MSDLPPDDETPQSKGGRARARNLTPKRKSEIAKRAAEARWLRQSLQIDPETVPRAICGAPDRPLMIGDVAIPCYVLEDGKRIIHQRGMVSALGMSRGGSSRGGGDRLAHFVAQRALSDFVSNDLIAVTAEPMVFRTPAGALAYGYDASILAEIAEAILEARNAGRLSRQQEHIADKAEALIRAFARVGIIALVDEATGYQEIRARDELQKILAAYISPELLPWAKRFPDAFYQELHRVRGWAYKPGSNARNAYIGKITRAIIYDPLPPGVIKDLESKNPYDPVKKRRPHLHHRFLTQKVGHPHLEKQIVSVTTLLRISDNWTDFTRHFSRAFPPANDLFALMPPPDEPEHDA